MTTNEKLGLLRDQMQSQGIHAFIVYSADPHMSEYLPKNWLERAWLTGFTGSAGFVVVTQDKAALWTDSRYFVQAPKELEGSEIILMKDGYNNTPDYISWLKKELKAKDVVATNALVTSHHNWIQLEKQLSQDKILLKNADLLKDIWTNRPMSKDEPIFVHPQRFAGKSVQDKLANIKNAIEQENADTHIITALDDVAWTLNLRGSDVNYNPVFLGYIIIEKDKVTLFIEERKADESVKQHLKEAKVEIKPYNQFFNSLEQLHHKIIWVSPTSNQAIYNAVRNNNKVIAKEAPGHLMKAIKNDTELQGFRNVMVRDGVAMVKFIHWLKHKGCKENLTEYEVGKHLKAFRAEGENFVGESFGSIIGYQSNGAIVHYSAKEHESSIIQPHGSILVDSGGQYLEGTTDITRTFALGEVSSEFIVDCTLALQGMINLSRVHFPKGTKGVHLDAFARQPLWMHHKDYGHGTGHGVGSFMNVHEGPQNFRKDLNEQNLIPGMVLSNEPGFYVEGKYGIRHENLVAVKEVEKTDFGNFYELETLTICPFFLEVIDLDMLTASQKDWLNQYHSFCREKLAVYLDGEVKKWFLEITQTI